MIGTSEQDLLKSASPPWWTRVALAMPDRPWVAPLVFAIVSFGVGDGAARLMGADTRAWSDRIGFALYMGNAIWAHAYITRGALVGAATAAPLLEGGPADLAATLRRIVSVDGHTRWIAPLVGVVSMVLLRGTLDGGIVDLFTNRAEVVVLTTWVWVWIAPFLVHGFLVLREVMLLGRGAVIDLTRLDPLSGLALPGLRGALAMLVGAAITNIQFTLAPEGDPGPPISFILALNLFWSLVAIGFVVLPTWLLHGRIEAARRDELRRVDAALEGDENSSRSVLIARRGEAPDTLELLTYRDWVVGRPGWPIASEAQRRFALFLLIPIASWIASAVVEEWVGEMLR